MKKTILAALALTALAFAQTITNGINIVPRGSGGTPGNLQFNGVTAIDGTRNGSFANVNLSGAFSGTHAQNVGTGDSPTFANMVTLNTTQTISAAKTFSGGITTTAGNFQGGGITWGSILAPASLDNSGSVNAFHVNGYDFSLTAGFGNVIDHLGNATFASVTSPNLVDKTSNQTISGAKTFSGGITSPAGNFTGGGITWGVTGAPASLDNAGSVNAFHVNGYDLSLTGGFGNVIDSSGNGRVNNLSVSGTCTGCATKASLGIVQATAQFGSTACGSSVGQCTVASGLSSIASATANQINGAAPTEYIGASISGGSVTFYSSNTSSSSFFAYSILGTP